MSNLRKFLIICLSVCCISLIAGATACGKVPDFRTPSTAVTDNGSNDKNNPNGDLPFYYPDGADPTEYDDPNNTYLIHTTSLGGLPIDGVKISVSKNGVTLVEGRSSNGAVKFGLTEGEYDLSYSDLPNGYFTDEEGTLFKLGEEHEVTTSFGSAVINATAPSGYIYNLGDVMYDFRVTDTNNKTVVLSELLAEKRLVVINLWYTNCSWCLKEFPAINEAYNLYKDTVEIVALAPASQGDTPTSIKNFQNKFTYEETSTSGQTIKHNLDFIMAFDSANITDHFNIAGFPTSIFVDRYGVIAYAEPQAQTSPNAWIDNFEKFTADDYKQSADMGSIGDGEQTETSATPPPSNIAPLPSSSALTEALLEKSMLQGGYSNLPLSFRGPDPDIEDEANDAERNWPFHIGEDSDGLYIHPSNIGEGTNNTFSILFTSVELEADQVLTVEIKLNTEDNNDVLFIYKNRSTSDYYSGSGTTGGWKEEILYTATRHTKVELLIIYMKNMTVTEENEFVGLRNLKIASINEDTNEPVDIHTEVAQLKNGSLTYASIYLGDDGFYHVYTKENQKLKDDPLLLVDVLGETLWSDRHIPDFSLVSFDGAMRVNSLYNICYWLFNKNVEADQDDETINNNLIFGDMGSANSDVVIDSYYIQSNSISLVPVSAKVRTALEKFVEIAPNHTALRDYYKNGNNEFTWLELCSYYRMSGGSHTVENHTCLGTTNPALGKILEYAIELQEGKNSVTSTDYTMKNRLGGLFYQFTAPRSGVYRFESLYNHVEGDPIDPKIVVWGSVTANPYRGDAPIAEADETRSASRMKNTTTNFKLFIYLKEGQTIYPQLTTSSAEYPGLYDFEIVYIGATHYELQIATTGEGMWSFYLNDDDTMGSLYYIAIPTIYDNTEDRYYHRIGDERGSIVYIDFLMSNFFDQNGNSIYDVIKRGAFDFSDSLGMDLTSEMLQYYERAVDKDKSDPTYGMVEADSFLVEILTVFAQTFGDGDETVESGIWKAFAYYWQYYGPEDWVEMN